MFYCVIGGVVFVSLGFCFDYLMVALFVGMVGGLVRIVIVWCFFVGGFEFLLLGCLFVFTLIWYCWFGCLDGLFL